MIAVLCPAQQCVALNRESRLIECGKCAVGQLVDVASMQVLGATSEAFVMQNIIHLRRIGPPVKSARLAPFFRKGLRVFAAALEARPVPGRQRRRLVEKKQLGIKAAPDVAPAALEVENAADPLPRRPPTRRQCLRVRVKAAAAVAHEQPARTESA